MASVEAGTSATSRITIDRGRTVDFLGEQLRIYATPELVRDFEIACRALLQQYEYYGDEFTIECPTGSGVEMNLFEVAREIARRYSAHTDRVAVYLPYATSDGLREDLVDELHRA